MAKDRNRTPEDDNGAPSKRDRKSVSVSEPDCRFESDDGSKRSQGSSVKGRKRSRSRSSSRKSRDDDEDSFTSSSSESDSYTDSYSESEPEPGSSESEERRRRKRRERKKEEEEEERRRRRRRRKEKEKEKEKEKKKKRRKEREEREERKRKKRKEKKKKKDEDKGKTGAVTNLWGKYGIIRETDMWNKRPEFTAWLAEVKKVNLESLPNWEEKQMFKAFMEDHNTATFPSKKYYDLDVYYCRKMKKEIKRGSKNVRVTERTVFDDEEQRRLELLRVRERQKEEQVEELKRSMQSGMAQAMKEQAQLREEMAYQYKIGNSEAAAAIQRRLDPDVAM